VLFLVVNIPLLGVREHVRVVGFVVVGHCVVERV
jgi:hypothetical protein